MSVILQIIVLVTEPEVAAQVCLEDPLDIYVSLPCYFLSHESQKFQVEEKESKDRRFRLN